MLKKHLTYSSQIENQSKMPIKRCQRDNKKGYKWGSSGKCYVGPEAKEKALKQMRAIKSSQSKKRK
jgi:hypothetical protein